MYHGKGYLLDLLAKRLATWPVGARILRFLCAVTDALVPALTLHERTIVMKAAITVAIFLALPTWNSALAQVPKKQDIPKNLGLLKNSKRAEDRAYAAEQLGLRGQVRSSDVKEAVDPLVSAVKADGSVSVRKAAATALGRIALDSEKSVPALTDALKDKAVEVRIAAASALAAFGAEARSALPALRELASDKKKKESRVARQAIQSISGRTKN
jgi:hypothetical protein